MVGRDAGNEECLVKLIQARAAATCGMSNLGVLFIEFVSGPLV